jgi:L-lactate dehydrogenase complex protein LldF
MPARSKNFQKQIDKAVRDPDLATALTRGLTTIRDRRDNAFRELDFEGMRTEFRAIKEKAIEDLPQLIEQFTREAEAVGAKVHLATTIDDANRIIGDIAEEHGVKLAVKSKSMATEEIHLNHYLESRGVTAVETDLGEWILQLSNETPSHLIAPAIHKTREQIADIFRKNLKGQKKLSAETSELVKVARAELRQAFIDAGMGISGGNAGIADTGTIVLVSNEGNGRLVTTLPPVHVAVMGVEKIVPTLEDATKMLQLLPRSGTSQKLTSYVSFITGPSRSADIELDLSIGVHGPKEVHIVLLDNGRFAAREDEDLVDTLYCIRCGACSNVCPPYQIVSGHLFGHIYTGPIGLPLTAIHHGLDKAADPQSLCVSCNACQTVCPVDIPIPRMIMDVRERVVDEMGHATKMKDNVLERWASPKQGNRWMRMAARASSPLKDSEGYIKRIPLQGKMTKGRHLIAPTRNPLRDRIKSRRTSKRPSGPPPEQVFPGSQVVGQTVAYFPGCMIDRLMPEMGETAITVFEACGCHVIFPPDQHCCGLVALNSGDTKRGRTMAEQTIRMLEKVDADWIVSNSTSCYAAIVDDYRHLLQHDSDWLRRVERLAEKIVDATTFLTDVAKIQPLSKWDSGPVVTYHDACQSHNALGIKEQPRYLIQDVLGLELREMRDSSVCCGFGGSFAMDFPEVSSAILQKKLNHAEVTEAPVLVSDNPGCLMQIKGGLHARGSKVKALHLMELMAERLTRGSPVSRK